MIRGYKEFIRHYNMNNMNNNISSKNENFLLKESISQAKTYLKNKALNHKKNIYSVVKDTMTSGGKLPNAIKLDELGITNDEIRKVQMELKDDPELQPKLSKDEVAAVIEDPNFKNIINMLRGNTGYVYLFTKLFYEDLSDMDDDKEKFNELKTILDYIKKYKQSLGDLPMPIDRYVSKNANNEELKKSKEEGRTYRKPIERIIDDFDKLKIISLTKNWISKLSSKQKSWFKDMTPELKDRVEGIAVAFDEYGFDKSKQTFDEHKKKALWDDFFKKSARYNNLDYLLKAAENNIMSNNNANYGSMIYLISQINEKYGDDNGVEVFYDDGNILVIIVKSYQANVELNSNTSHCIATSNHQWETYAGLETFNLQYYIYDFNLNPSDKKSVIGVTVKENGSISAAHLKDDTDFKRQILDHLNRIGVPELEPMSVDVVTRNKNKIRAKKEIIKPNITLDELKILIEVGGDPNQNEAKPLSNAVYEDNLEKVEYLLSVGSNPNLVKNLIFQCKGYDMLLLIVKNSNLILDREAIEAFIEYDNMDIDKVKELLENSTDVDLGHLLFKGVVQKNVDLVNLAIDLGADVSHRNFICLKRSALAVAVSSLESETGFQILSTLMDQLQKSEIYKDQEVRETLIGRLKKYIDRSTTLSEVEKNRAFEIINM